MSGIGSLSLSFSPCSVCEPRKERIASLPAERAKARRRRALVSWFVWSDGTLSLVICLETTCSDAKAVPVIVSFPPRIKAAKSGVVIFILFTAFPVKAYLTRPGPYRESIRSWRQGEALLARCEQSRRHSRR